MLSAKCLKLNATYKLTQNSKPKTQDVTPSFTFNL